MTSPINDQPGEPPLTRIAHWDQMQQLEEMHTRLTGVFRRTPPRRVGDRDTVIPSSEWTPLVDITEDDQGYMLKVELPEVSREDIRVAVEQGVLHITGERKLEPDDQHRRYHRVERAYGNFLRTFALPADADGGRVEASYKDGLLRVTIAKMPATHPNSVEIKVTGEEGATPPPKKPPGAATRAHKSNT